MAKVSFWGVQHGLGTTSNTSAIAAWLGFEYQMRVLLSQPQMADTTLEQCFFKAINPYNRQIHEFSGTGVDALERAVRSNKLERDTIKNHALILDQGFDLLEGTKRLDKLQFENSNDALNIIFDTAQQYYEMVLLDVHSGLGSKLALETIETSDLVVVCLNQNINILDKYFKQQLKPESLSHIPHLVLLGQYDEESKYKLRNIAGKYKFKGKLLALPYNTGYRDAMNDGDLKNFFIKHRHIQKGHPHFKFFSQVQKICNVILEEVGLNPKQYEERRLQ